MSLVRGRGRRGVDPRKYHSEEVRVSRRSLRASGIPARYLDDDLDDLDAPTLEFLKTVKAQMYDLLAGGSHFIIYGSKRRAEKVGFDIAKYARRHRFSVFACSATTAWEYLAPSNRDVMYAEILNYDLLVVYNITASIFERNLKIVCNVVLDRDSEAKSTMLITTDHPADLGDTLLRPISFFLDIDNGFSSFCYVK